MQYFVEIMDLGIRYACDDTESILCGMARLQKKGIPIGCCGGGCGVCKVEIIAGDVMCLSMSSDHISGLEKKRNIVLACRTYPRSNLAVKIVGRISKSVNRAKATKIVSVSMMQAWRCRK